MLNSDEERLETYLKSFRPAAPMPLPKANLGKQLHLFAIVLAAVLAAVLIGAAVVWHRRIEQVTAVKGELPSTPLTIGSANRWIATAQSVDAALNSLGSQPKGTAVAATERGALALLAEQDETL